jgi:hypothetical protein
MGVDQSVLMWIITGLFAFLIVFVVLREVMCWYWKINQIVDKLTEISNTLKAKEEKKLTAEDYF